MKNQKSKFRQWFTDYLRTVHIYIHTPWCLALVRHREKRKRERKRKRMTTRKRKKLVTVQITSSSSSSFTHFLSYLLFVLCSLCDVDIHHLHSFVIIYSSRKFQYIMWLDDSCFPKKKIEYKEREKKKEWSNFSNKLSQRNANKYFIRF